MYCIDRADQRRPPTPVMLKQGPGRAITPFPWVTPVLLVKGVGFFGGRKRQKRQETGGWGSQSGGRGGKVGPAGWGGRGFPTGAGPGTLGGQQKGYGGGVVWWAVVVNP